MDVCVVFGVELGLAPGPESVYLAEYNSRRWAELFYQRVQLLSV